MLFSSEESKSSLFQGESGARMRYAVLGLTLFLLAVLLIPIFSHEARRWSGFKPEINVPDALWRVYYGEAPGMCGMSAADNDGCPANPASPYLWSSTFNRANAAHGERVKLRGNSEYWMGVTLPFALIMDARSADANHLHLGRVRGDYRVWIDGEYSGEGRASDRDPPIVVIPPSLFEAGRAVQIAVRVTNGKAPGAAFTDGAGQVSSGLLSRAKAVAFRRNHSFLQEAKPFALLLLNLFIGALLMSFWNGARSRLDLLLLGLFAWLAAAAQAKKFEAVHLFIGHGADVALWKLWAFYSGPLIFFSTLAFVGARRRILGYGLPLTLVALPAANRLTTADLAFTISDFFLPSLCGLSVLVCIARIAQLNGLRGPEESFSTRMSHTVIFAAGVLVLGAASLFVDDFSMPSLAAEAAQPAAALALGFVARRGHLLERDTRLPVPVSRYHCSAALPGELAGAVLVVDLRMHSDMPGQGQTARACITHVWTAITDHDGVIIQATDGRVDAFFEEPPEGSGASSAARALSATEKISRNFSQLEAGVFQGMRLGFHAGVACGTLRPMWEAQGSVPVPAWTHTREGMDPVFDANRLVTVSRKIGAPWRSVAMEAKQATTSAAGWAWEERTVDTAHGEKLAVAIHVPGRLRADEDAA